MTCCGRNSTTNSAVALYPVCCRVQTVSRDTPVSVRVCLCPRLRFILILFCFVLYWHVPRPLPFGRRPAPCSGRLPPRLVVRPFHYLFVLFVSDSFCFLVFYRSADPWGPFYFGIPFLGTLARDHGNWPSQVMEDIVAVAKTSDS